MTILIVRLGALGDVVHAVPAAAALRRALPNARIDWVVDARHAAFVRLVEAVDRVIPLDDRSVRAWLDLVRRLRPARYDAALDFQGLMKSAVLARASGARRVLGFSLFHLREKGARPFYSEVEAERPGTHVILKNLALLAALGVRTTAIEFPIAPVVSRPADDVVQEAAGRPVALLNPGAAWPNKRWPPARFGSAARALREAHGMHPVVLWGPGEEALASEVVDASGGAARLAPPTGVADLVALSRAAALMISGDTGPLHVAAAVGTATVSLFGPTDPARNGPWRDGDEAVSRFGACRCHYRRRCRQREWCLGGVAVADVMAAAGRRIGRHDAARA